MNNAIQYISVIQLLLLKFSVYSFYIRHFLPHGTSYIPVQERLEQEGVGFVYLCLDNDSAGNKASVRMSDLLAQRGILSARLTPVLKDWNEDLCAGITEEQEAEQCPVFQSF